MNRYAIVFLGVGCLSLLSVNVGCQPAADASKQDTGHGHEHDHDHSDRPKTLQAAIEELKGMRDAIRTAMEEDDPDSAHDPLHEVGQLLKAIPDLAADTDLPEDEWDAIKAEADRLFDAFGDIDSAFHKKDGDRRAAYDAAESTVDEAVAALEAYLPKLGKVDSPAKHKHGEHKHGEKKHGEHDHGGHDDEVSHEKPSE